MVPYECLLFYRFKAISHSRAVVLLLFHCASGKSYIVISEGFSELISLLLPLVDEDISAVSRKIEKFI